MSDLNAELASKVGDSRTASSALLASNAEYPTDSNSAKVGHPTDSSPRTCNHGLCKEGNSITTSTTVSRRPGVAAAAAMVPGAAAVLGVGYSASLDALLAPYDIETKRIIHKVVDDVLSLIPPPRDDALDRHDRVADPSADPVFAAIEKRRRCKHGWRGTTKRSAPNCSPQNVTRRSNG